MKPYRAVLFDLDGTLLNTLDDLADSLNAVLRQHGFPEWQSDDVRTFVGNGAEALLRAALPEGTDDDTLFLCLAEFKAYYQKHMEDRTRPYDGIPALLDALRTEGVRIAVASNKFHAAVQGLCERYFPGKTDLAVGECQTDGLTIRRKPAPDMLFLAAERLQTPLADCVYIGDSEVDVQTAKNAGMDCICVSWGFREEAALRMVGAETIAESPQTLAALLLHPQETAGEAKKR